MAWIDIIDESDATGELADVYEEVADNRGKVSNILRVHSLHPQSMADHLDLYSTVMFSEAGLGREEREMIATVVSIANDCEYCIRHHAVALNAYWRDEEQLEAFLDDWRALELSGRRRALLTYAEALTRDPASVEESDVEALRKVGLDDEAILNVNLVVSYFNFVNRIAEGLGVEYTAEEMQGYEY